MKKMFLAIAAVVMSANVMAQDVKEVKPERQNFDMTEMVKKRTEETVKQLDLNEEQAAKLLELNMKFSDKMRPGMRGQRPGMRGGNPQMRGERPMMRGERPMMRGERPMVHGERPMVQKNDSLKKEGIQPADFQKMREEMQANRKAYDEELKQILTDEQYTKYKENEEKRFKERRGGPRGQKNE